MKVLALVTDAYGVGGGIAQYNRDLMGALDACTQVDKILVLPRSGSSKPQGLPDKVRQLKPRPQKAAWALAALRTAWLEGPFDVVFCGHLFSSPVAALAARIADAPLWLQLHGIEAWERPHAVQRAAAERAQLITVVSRHSRNKFLSWANCCPETVKVLPNTVEARFLPGPRNPALEQRYGLTNKKVLLTVSRLASTERYKGHKQVMQALARLKPAWPDVVYVIAGDGDDQPRLQALAQQLGVADSTRFVGYVQEADLPDLYRTADLFVMPSTGEGFGIVFLQALASGVPVIGGGTDGSRDPLRDGLNGHLMAGSDPAELAETIGSLLDTPPVTGNNADAFARQNFNAMVDQLVQRFARQ